MILTEEQKEKIRKHVRGYNAWPEKERNEKERMERHDFFINRLSKQNIDKLSENDFREVYKTLWASNIWGNKDWYVDNKLLEPNGLPKIKEELKKLLYEEDDISVRFDNFMKNIKGFGPSSISEILHFAFPAEYCLWNDKPKTVVPFLGINILPEKFFKYNLQNGVEYGQCINALKIIKDELENNGFNNPDFMDLDCFFWYVFNTIDFSTKGPEPEPPKKETILKIHSHEDAEEIILKLGKILNFYPYLTAADRGKIKDQEILNEILTEIPDFTGERDKSSAREIDVTWFDEFENPRYCFEVEHTTDITKGLNRLFQLKQFDVKFVIVAPEDKRNKFESEMGKSPFRTMRDKYKFVFYDELVDLYEKVTKYKEAMVKLFGQE